MKPESKPWLGQVKQRGALISGWEWVKTPGDHSQNKKMPRFNNQTWGLLMEITGIISPNFAALPFLSKFFFMLALTQFAALP